MKIDKNITWNDYCKKYKTDSLYLVEPITAMKMYQIQEGSGDNLDEEDEKNGFVDYFNTYLYDTVNMIDEDGGMWLETEYISERNYTINELISRMKECDAPADIDKWIIIDPAAGDEMESDIISTQANRILAQRKWAKKVLEV